MACCCFLFRPGSAFAGLGCLIARGIQHHGPCYVQQQEANGPTFQSPQFSAYRPWAGLIVLLDMWVHISSQIQDTGTSSPMSWTPRLARRPNVTPFHLQHPRTVLAFRLLDRFASACPIRKLAFLSSALEGCLKHINLAPFLPSVRFQGAVRGARLRKAISSKGLVVFSTRVLPGWANGWGTGCSDMVLGKAHAWKMPRVSTLAIRTISVL